MRKVINLLQEYLPYFVGYLTSYLVSLVGGRSLKDVVVYIVSDDEDTPLTPDEHVSASKVFTLAGVTVAGAGAFTTYRSISRIRRYTR